MNRLLEWWSNDLPKGVKFVLFVLLANGLPAFVILMTLPTRTETLFVWTINPVINARLIGVMYGNALLLVAIGALQTSWARVRVNMVVITLFSVLATLLTFFFLKPFLAHPWYHLTYWLTMYLILFFAAPAIFVFQELESGGKLPVQAPLNIGGRLVALLSLLVALIWGLLHLFNIDFVNQYWPWTMPPLVGGLIGVLFITHFGAYTWALWDGDWMRVRPIFWQAPPTALLFILLPLVHFGDLRPDSTLSLLIFLALAGLFGFLHLVVILSHRGAEQRYRSQGS